MLFSGATDRRIREHNDRMHHAWIVARLTAYAPKKSNKFVKLDELIQKPPANGKPQQNADQQIEVMRSILAARKR